MVNQEAIAHLEDYCKSIMTDEMVLQWKRNFNKMADKARKADDWMDADNVASKDKDMQFLYYKLEVLEPFTRYLEVFQNLGIKLPEDPFAGYPEAR
jgi:hypothetical protein